ncbi:MAG TPA: CoB--CoM heterodisulfide reductase iron-sulfur subunit B family protein [Syntrophomonadaceae bacterium]|nr:CoB--CoM heterodisulfide reductase iron-sulfur subunit B family protein [Syntrophomonadaceae bacterium]
MSKIKLAYYPGCSLGSSGIEYHLSTKKTAELLGVELEELEDWNCCGATSAHNTNKLLSLALPARNLAIAEKTGLDILAPCAACYNRFRNTEHAVREDVKVKEQIEQVIDMDYEASNKTISVLEWLAGEVGLDKIKDKVTNSLQGMKAASYYGCLLVRPSEQTGFDDVEDPQSMDNIIETLGATSVDWSYKSECCGAALATSRPEIGNKMIYSILKNAKESGAECIVTACPLCMMNLDMRQAGAEKAFQEKFDMPIYYITELVAIAAGETPNSLGVNKHFVEANSYLDKIKQDQEKAAVVEVEEKEEMSPEELEKKMNAMIKGLEKNPERMALRIIEDEARAAVLAEIIVQDEKKTSKIAELMITDREKAIKVAEAFVTGELRKREKAANQ